MSADERNDDARTEGALEDASAETLEARLVEAEKARDENLASWQRSQADYQNLRRRLQADIDAAVARSKTALLTDLMLVLDYLEMALATPVTTSEGHSLRAGVEATKLQLVRALEREGVTPVRESGPFDAAIHQAVERVETTKLPPNEIVSTLRRGYVANGTVLRPAQVRVAVAAAEEESGEQAGRDGGPEHGRPSRSEKR